MTDIDELRALIDFLNGQGSLDNKWFSDQFRPIDHRQPYWWRDILPDLSAALDELAALRSAQQWRGIESGPRRRFELWFFRECNQGTRRQLYSLFEMPMDEIRNQGHERMVFMHIINHIAAPLPETGAGQ